MFNENHVRAYGEIQSYSNITSILYQVLTNTYVLSIWLNCIHVVVLSSIGA
jgi:hypothetical protein